MPNSNLAIIALCAAISATAAHTSSQILSMQAYHHTAKTSFLRRSTSLSSDLSDSTREQSESVLRQTRRTYSPAHTPPPELSSTRRNLRCNEMQSVSHDSVQPRVFTKIQTKLYPEMRF